MRKMKANSKFTEADEYAVSAVIGVILMVAITVAIAATVYVYVSGMIGKEIQSTPRVTMTASPVATTGICSVTIATVGQPNIAWAIAVTANLNCITNGTKMVGADIVLPLVGNIAGGDIIQCKNLVAGNQYSLTLTYKATGGTMGTVKWNQI
jgi:tellurite resistance protein TehA-like permease